MMQGAARVVNAPAAPTPPRSRNDLFTTSWTPDAPPPRPLAWEASPRLVPSTPLPRSASSSSLAAAETAGVLVAPSPSPLAAPFGRLPNESLLADSDSSTLPATIPSPARTSSLSALATARPVSAAPAFTAAAAAPPPPSLSKTSSFFATAADNTPPPAPRLTTTLAPSPLSLSRASSFHARRAFPSLPSPPPQDCTAETCAADPALTPLHQSPSLPASGSTWEPPRPPASDISLRFYPEPAYLLGEGRYARVYLASYKRDTPGRPLRGHGAGWTLCAAKRLAPDRESQTMGLREAFFLNRLTGGDRRSDRARSPLRSSTLPRENTNTADDHDESRGRVYVVKLIGVKEDSDDGPRAHARSVSDQEALSGRARQRSSTIYATRKADRGSYPNLAALADDPTAPPSPSISRLVLVLEHAPLGTMDRLLRDSPGLVGEVLWGRWAREAAEALEWVHAKGVVHADVKPSNLLLTTDLHLRLSDFGSSLLIHPAHPPTDGVGLGTLPFSAPELVDPHAPFSFAVDIFALGATLYQCITGREPYRGVRPVELVHQVRNGALWNWEERDRLHRIGTGASTTMTGSPYPSAWRDDVSLSPVLGDGAQLRRAGSLRVPHTPRATVPPSTPGITVPPSPTRLYRVGSAESLQAADDVGSASAAESPAGVKLWAAWARKRTAGHVARDPLPIHKLLRADDEPELTPPPSPTPSRSSSLRRAGSVRSITGQGAGIVRSSSLRSPSIVSPTFRTDHSPTSPGMYASIAHHIPSASTTSGLAAHRGSPTGSTSSQRSERAAETAAYADGAPAMYFLGGGRVGDGVRDVVRGMLEGDAAVRPTARGVVEAWNGLGVGVGEEECVSGGESG